MGDSVLQSIARRPRDQAAVLFPRGPIGLPAMLTGVGRALERSETYDWHGLKRGRAPFALLQHTFAGRGDLAFEGRRYAVRAGETMLLYFPHDHRYRLLGGASWDFFWVCLNGSEVMRLWREVVERGGPVRMLAPGTLETAAEACRAALDGELAGPGHASGLAYAVAARLVDELAPEAGRRGERAGRAARIDRAIRYLREHLAEPIGVAEMAEAAGLSRYHFTRRFTESEGIAPGAFIVRERMKRAVALLQRGDVAIKTVARRSGYPDPNYFAKVFRRSFRVSPSAFRDHRMFRGQ